MTIQNDILEELDEKYGKETHKLLGTTLLAFPDSSDSSRLNMLTQHLKQTQTLLYPEVPRVFSGFENKIGEYNKAYKKLPGKWKVVDKIRKFGTDHIYTIILYNKDQDIYNMIEKKPIENLTEIFGFTYDTSEMDKLEPNDVIKDKIIYKSTSYDKNMNYRMGINANVLPITDPRTLEDVIKARRGWLEKIKLTETNSVDVSINDNDILLNLYGDENNYKTFPDIGENIENATVCATRRIKTNKVLFDFQEKNIRKILNGDSEYFAKGIVYDIDIYCNAEEFPDNIFYRQLKIYYDSICRYADEVTAWCSKIKESGSKYTPNIGFLKSKYQHYTNKSKKWKNKDRAFNNILVKFKTVNIVGLMPGFKLTGRYGNKGVIGLNDFDKDANTNLDVDFTSNKSMSDAQLEEALKVILQHGNSEEDRENLFSKVEIVDDDEMPYVEFEDGERLYADLWYNLSGCIRRLNFGQMDEIELNFISENVRRRVKSLPTLEAKVDLIFKYLGLINENECKFMYDMYQSYDRYIEYSNSSMSFNIHLLDEQSKINFVKDIEENGFYIEKPPFSNIRYNLIANVYKEFDWIKPYTMYINVFGMKKKIIRPMVMGEEYMFILKHTTNKNFSVRSVAKLNKKNLPEKSNDKKNGREVISSTPIKIGEAYNLFAAISGMDLAEYNIFMRSSPLGRKSLKSILNADGNPLDVKKLEMRPEYTNVNALWLNAILKTMGIRLNFVGDKDIEVVVNVIQPMLIRNRMVMDTPSNKEYYITLFDTYDKLSSTNIVVETYPGEKQDIIWNMVFEREDIKELPIYDKAKTLYSDIRKKTYKELLEKKSSDEEDKEE